MTSNNDRIEMDRTQLAALIERVEEAIEHELALSVEDMKLLLSAISTLCTLQSKLEQDDITLHKLRKLLGMIRQSEKRGGASRARAKRQNKHGKSSAAKRNKDKKSAPKKEYHSLTAYQKGQACPACLRGKLYKFEPTNLLRITGHTRYEATQHIAEQLRCNACQQVYTAPLPESVLADGDSNQMYGYSARSLMVLDKFYSGLPYHHQENIADIFGFHMSASTIYDQCEWVANDAKPIIYELHRQAAVAPSFLIDDTHNRILNQQPELRDKRHGNGKQLRSGVYTSGLIAKGNKHDIILFQTSLGHAGEHLDFILEHRDKSLPMPMVMSDALSSNKPSTCPVIACYCNAHARRQFYDLEEHYPEDVAWVLDTYGKIWEQEAYCKDNKLNPDERLTHHHTHSLPVMQSLREWMLQKKQAEDFEEHSAMGKAIRYFLKHYEALTQFCKQPGALIDNNPMEEKLKIPIRGRKTAHFYKTAIGAEIASDLISLIATTIAAGINVYDYLCAIQKNRERVKQHPDQWLPWQFQETLAVLEKKKTFDSS